MATITKDFAFNILSTISTIEAFSWDVGDGPLYWWRVELKEGVGGMCSPGAGCSAVKIACQEKPNHGPVEVWHMLATSKEHLCTRMNTESCNRNVAGKKIFKSVSKYLRPALCCDVDQLIKNDSQITDEYVAQDMCVCECISFVDPCSCIVMAPCDESTPSKVSTTEKVFEFIGTVDGLSIEPIKIHSPKKNMVRTGFGYELPPILRLKHNLLKSQFLRNYAARHGVPLQDTFDLGHDGKSWRKTIKIGDLSLFLEWTCERDSSDYVWLLNLDVNCEGRRAGVTCQVSTPSGMTSDFLVSFNLNTKTKMVAAKQPASVKISKIYDDVGIFKGAWEKDPYLSFEISK